MTVQAMEPASDFSAALYAFLDKMSPSMIGRLYESPASCLSIFRLLPATARHVVLNMLWYDEVVTTSTLSLWIRQRRTEPNLLENVLLALARLHIMSQQKGKGDDARLTMNERFKANFKLALTGGGLGSFGVPSDERREGLDIAFLDGYAETQWEAILHFMVGSQSGAHTPSDEVLALLVRSELMASSTGNLHKLKISSKGFQFLLEEVNKQLWDLLLEYLEASSDVVQVLGFLFMLGSLELGRGYSVEPLTEVQRFVLDDLRDYGLVYLSSSSSKTFYPTRLATTLTSTAPPLVSTLHLSSDARGFLIVETNYKVYAYTSNPLQIAVLNLFVHLKSRFPNFVTGQITRDSIKDGLANGITADQIVSYLTSRAHPQMRKSASILPTTVVDQIRLWEREGQRVSTTEGYLYDDFSSTSDFQLVANYARELGVLLWELPRTRKLFVTVDGHLQIREFIRRRMAAVG